MAITDPIADMLTAIRNATRAKKQRLEVPASNLKQRILDILKREGYIQNYRFIEDKRQGILRIYLRFDEKSRPAITNLKRISKPGLRVYFQKDEVPKVLRGKGLAILSTSKGVLTDRQAREKGIGGELLLFVW